MSASGATTTGFFPPSSRVTGTRFSAAARCTRRPTPVDPVKKRWSSGSRVKAAPTSGPPVTTASSDGSKYFTASERVSSAVCAVISDILIMTRLPAANAEAAGTTTNWSGKFHGPMMPTTPRGAGWTSVRMPYRREIRLVRTGRIHRARCERVCSNAVSIPMISANSVPVRERVPKSRDIASTKSSMLSRTMASSRSIRSRRTAADGGPSRRNARRCSSRIAVSSAGSVVVPFGRVIAASATGSVVVMSMGGISPMRSQVKSNGPSAIAAPSPPRSMPRSAVAVKQAATSLRRNGAARFSNFAKPPVRRIESAA